MQTDILLPRSSDSGPPRRLVLVFHGVGSNSEDMLPLAQAIAGHDPQAAVVCVRAPEPCDLGRGWQWFSVQAVTEATRPARVAAAMPAFVSAVERWQQTLGLTAPETTLVGFSQGAIMALESTQLPALPAHRVVAIAGRFAQSPRVAPPATTVHLLHGEADSVMPAVLAQQAADAWHAQGGSATLDLFPGLGHGVDPRLAKRLLQRLGG